MLHIKDLEAFASINAAIAGHNDDEPKTHEEREHRRIAAAQLFMRLAGATLRRSAPRQPADKTADLKGGEAEAQDLAAQLTEAAVNAIAAAAAENDPASADLSSPHSENGPLGLIEALAKQRDGA